MKKKKLAIITGLLVIVVVCTASYLEIQHIKRKRIRERSDIEYLSALVNRSLDLAEASDENDYLNAMEATNDILDLSNRWKGIEKKQRQQAYFVQEDVSKIVKNCKAEDCSFQEELTALERAVNTRIKALEQEDVQEINQLSALSSELLWKNFWHVINDLPVLKISQLGDSVSDRIVDRYFDLSVFDYVERKKWCKDLNIVYHDFARYKNYCDYDFEEGIRNVATETVDRDFNDRVLSTMISACSIEQTLKNIPDDAEKKCPHIGPRNLLIRDSADLYLSTKSK